MNTLYILATEMQSGKSAIALGMMQLLMKNRGKVAFFRPIIDQPADVNRRDPDIDLITKYFGLDLPYEDMYACTLWEARNLIHRGQDALLYDMILKKFKYLQGKYDFVLCEGTDLMGKNTAFELDLNAAIAANLGCPVLFVANALDKNCQEIIESSQVTIDFLHERGLQILCCVVNRAKVSLEESVKLKQTFIVKNSKDSDAGQALLTYVVPEEPALGNPSINEVRQWLNAQLIYGKEHLQTLVDNYLIAAMQVGNFLDYMQKGSLVITPGDRSDIILACLTSRYSAAYPDIAGILLTGGIDMPESVHKLINGLSSVSLPILVANENTSKTIKTLSYLYGKITADNSQKINAAFNHFETHVNTKELLGEFGAMRSATLTPMMFEYNLLERAAKHKMRIILPEATDERILEASSQLLQRDVVELIFVGDEKEIRNRMAGLGMTFPVKIIEPEKYERFDEYVAKYQELRKAKGITQEQARDTLSDPTYFSTMMVYMDEADGMVSGAIHTTAHTIRPAFEIIKTKPGASIVSSVFLMCLKDRVLVFGDCAVNPNPTSAQLADIAITSAQTAKIFGIDPKVAMLSYSTGKSGKGADVDIVVEATRIAQEKAPELLLEGPLQYDAAIDPTVARTKMPESRVAGHATVFIFPDLNTGNNTYKAVQRAADAVAIGPVLQGLNKPVNDLSRGCTVADIINTVAITAIQAQAEKGFV